MTLRDIGTWFSDKWNSIKEGFEIAATQSFLDWPLWISISLGIGAPLLVLWWIGALMSEAQSGKREPLGWTIGFAVATFLSAVVTFDLWVSMSIFEEGNKNVGWLRIWYPIMTGVFGSYSLVSVAKLRRHWHERSDRNTDKD